MCTQQRGKLKEEQAKVGSQGPGAGEVAWLKAKAGPCAVLPILSVQSVPHHLWYTCLVNVVPEEAFSVAAAVVSSVSATLGRAAVIVPAAYHMPASTLPATKRFTSIHMIP